jgi:nitrogen fixation protein FixH
MKPITSQATLAGPRTSAQAKSLWPKTIVLAFVCLALMDGVIVYLALRSAVPMIDEHPYEAALAFQDIVQGRSRALADEVTATFALQPTRLHIDLVGKVGDGPFTFSTRLIHTQFSNEDKNITITAPTAHFQADFPKLRSGTWMLQLTARSDTRTYYFESRAHIKD